MADEQSINAIHSEDTRHIYEKKRVIVPAITAIILLILGTIVSVKSIYYKSTDDAFVEGHIITVAPKVSGQVIKLNIEDNQSVKKGDLLLEIDSVDYQVKLKQAQAKLEEAKAALKKAQSQNKKDLLDYERYTQMYEKGISSKQDFDNSRNNLNSAESSVEEILATITRLEAEVEQAELDLSYTKIYATQDGKITHRTVEEGNYIQIAQPLFAISKNDVWVVANFKETQVANMKKGQPVEIKIDAFGNKKFHGVVDSIQMASGAKASLFPPENAVGSYVKIVQRIPVKILFTDNIDGLNIIPGMSAVPTVKVK